jgi:hypothetical protein
MIREFFCISAAVACIAGFVMSCNDPVGPGDGEVKVYSDGFEGDLSKWDEKYMIVVGDFYPHMQISAVTSHSGKNALTADSNRTALQYSLNDDNSIDHGIAGVRFYLMASENGGANFTVEIGKNAGSSGGLGKAFGIGFDPNDSIKCKAYDMLGNEQVGDFMVAPIQPGHWYKCAVEVDFTALKVRYSIDDATIHTIDLPSSDMSKIDRLLVFRGQTVPRPNYGSADCAEGKKQYYVDDIVFYKK